MRPTGPASLALVAVLLLAGCISGEEALDDTTTSADLGDVSPPVAPENGTLPAVDLDAPSWAVGDSWTFKSFGFNEEQCTLVVSTVGSDHVVAPDCEAWAINDAVFDISYVGRIRASDLAGAQGSERVQYYDFPLADGKTWTTNWDGQSITLKATFVPALDAPGFGKVPGYTIVGTNESGVYVTYDFAPPLKWFTKLEFAEGYGVRLQSFEPNWTGTVKSVTANPLVQYASLAPGFFVPPAETFSVAEGQSALAVFFTTDLGPHGYALQLHDPAGTIAWDRSGAGPTDSRFEITTLAPTPGEWKLVAAGSYDPNAGSIGLSLTEIALADVPIGRAA